jgi:hypothetical protein
MSIVDRLRDRAYSTKAGDPLCEEAAREIDRLRLTDAEREAVEFAICSLGRDDYLNERHAERLQETLERLKERLQ